MNLNKVAADFKYAPTTRESSADSIPSRFLEIASRFPDATALELCRDPSDELITLSYAELWERSHATAAVLIENGVKPGDRVALATGRNFDLIIGMLAILRAGASYVPIDLTYPAERQKFMLKDAGIGLAVTSDGLQQKLSHLGVQTLSVDERAQTDHTPLPDIDPNGAAYVMYTSGSTGRPKGVVTPHRAVCRLVVGTDYTKFGPDRRFLQLSSVSFDASTFEVWGALLNGGSCIIYPVCGLPDLEELRRVLINTKINTLWLTSSLFNSVIDTDPDILSNVEELLVGGEALSAEHIRKAQKTISAQLINGYGPTETTTFACTYRIPSPWPENEKSVPIGKPIHSGGLQILDENMLPVPDGKAGQLYIAGPGVAIGYLDQPSLTAERFVSLAGERSYRTGDLVLKRSDGNIEFVGREDDQVKVSGHRIELGEIEHLLCSHPAVDNAAAAVFKSKGNPDRIAAWIVWAPDNDDATVAALRAYCEEKLPTYMRPAIYTVIDSLPLTTSGKLDRRALGTPRTDRPELDYDFVAPREGVEEEVAEIWRLVIGVDRVGRHDRFFDLGGTSLMSLQVLEALRRQKGYSLGVAEFFDGPTVEKIAAAIQRSTPNEIKAPVVNARPSTGSDRIAVVGIGGRFAGAADVFQFWDMLVEGRSGRVEVTREDLLAAGEDPDLLDDPDYVAAAFPLDDAEGFDARFFGFSPREVQIMDPQQRIFLETAWCTLENAGHDPHQSQERIGVFGGIGRNAYLLNNLMSHPHLREAAAEYNMLIGNERDFPATHVAFRLGLRGPAVTVQTACSTSGVAIHMAAESLRRGECDIALAGGAKVLVPNRVGYRWTEGGPLSSDGYLRAFDAEATGMVRGSGCAMVALKRLESALEDGDHVYGVIIGSAINNDGSMKAGFTAPSVSGQAEAISGAYDAAGIQADSISMIEAHGTGTVLGDPIEFSGLTRAFGEHAGKANSCAIGSVKTNIGHLDAGATAAGLIKTVLSLEKETIPPSLNFETPNPNIDFQNSPMFVPTSATPWRRSDNPRRAGISSFGLGGTNVHLVVEEAPVTVKKTRSVGPELLILSARTETALARKARDLADWLEENYDCALPDVAHTLRLGRRCFEKRLAFVVHDREDAIDKLRNSPPEARLFTNLMAEAPPVVFLFPGGGAQYAQMARGLYEANSAFRETIDACSTHFRHRTGQSLTEVIFDSDEPLERTSVALPALLAVEIAMARLWRSWGVTPKTMLGHSVGEYAAACLAEVFSLEDAMDIVICRGQLFETLQPGAMLSVQCNVEDLGDIIGQDLSIAAVNRPGSCVVSGPSSEIDTFAKTLSGQNIESRRVHINVAAHSKMVDPILEQFRAAFENIELNPPKFPFISNVTGRPIAEAEATDPDYWVQHLRSTVEFSKGLSTAFSERETVFLEIGPGQTLSSFARQHADREEGHEVVATIRHPQEAANDREFLLAAVGKYWRAGGVIDWSAYAEEGCRRVPLPSYPFERVRHWIDPIPFGASDVAPVDTRTETEDQSAPVELEATAPLSRLDQISLQLSHIISRLSGLSLKQIDPHATFLELGFDSLFLTQANAAFKKAFKVPLTTRQLLEATPRLSSLAEYLDGVLEEDFELDLPSTDASTPAGSSPTGATASAHEKIKSPGIASVTTTQAKGLSPEQNAHIDALIAQTVARTPKAKEATQASRKVLADPRTVQGFRLRWKEMVYPILSDRAKGSKVWDIDGNEYIDLVGGYGVTFLGHQSDVVVDAIKAQIDKTLAIGPQSVLAGEVAKLVSDLTGMERVAFCNTGSEAVLAAVRMARTVTGKSRIAKFDGHYHGIFDEMQVRGTGQGSRNATLPSAPGIPHEAVQNTIILDYGNPDAFEVIREQAENLALVLVEPVRSRSPDFQPKEYLQELRSLTEELGIPLLFDEIVTGFRSHPGGAQHLFGVKADLVTYGKVVGGGLPIGIVTGSSTYMDTLDGGMWDYGDDSVPPADMTWFAGTFVRHPMALAATRATLQHLVAEGPALQQGLNARSEKLASDLNELMCRLKVPIKVEQFASVLRVRFTAFQEYGDLLFFHLRNRGVMTYEGRPIFLTTAHSDKDLQKVYEAFEDSARALIAVGLLEGRDPTAARRLPMATGQQEIWVSAQFSEDASRSYNLCSTLRLKGALSTEILQQALNDLADRHEALRSLPERDGLMQMIRADLTVPLVINDLSALDQAARDAQVEDLKQDQVRIGFDLKNGPLVRANVICLRENDHLVLLTVHHAIADGWSCGVLLRDLGALYAARRDGDTADLDEPLQLSDFVNYQRHPDQIASRAQSRDYWLSLHSGGLKRVDFPSDRPRPTRRDYAASRIAIPLDRELTQSLRKVAGERNTTLFAALMGGFAAYVTRLTGSADNTIGFSAAGQPLLGGGSLVGHCVSFLPLKLVSDLDGGFGDHLSKIGNSILDALEHQNFDFVSFVQEIQPDRTAEFAPLITVGLNLDPSTRSMEFAHFDVEAGSVGRAFENLDLFLNFVEFNEDLELQCTFNTALFNKETISRRMDEYLEFLRVGAQDPTQAMGRLEFFNPGAFGADLEPENGEDAFDRDAGVTDIFKRVCARYPANIAVKDASCTNDPGLSYEQLDNQSELWAERLMAAGVGIGDNVVLLLPRSVDFVIVALAVLKCGAAYVPLNVEAPVPSLVSLIEDSQARVVLAQSDFASIPIGDDVNLLLVDQIGDGAASSSGVRAYACGGDPAYIMYTSGSSAEPKGVVVPHRAITSLVHSTEYADLNETRTVAFLAAPSFDASTFEIWGALLNGGTVAVIPGTMVPQLSLLNNMLENAGVTTLWLTAALFNAVVDQHPKLPGCVRELLTGGEALSVSHVKTAQQNNPGLKVINGYGPTECTTFTCCHPVPSDFPTESTSVPIGRPIFGRNVKIVDDRLRPLPAGVPGELVVWGDGLALGYWNRADLTDTAFVEDPSGGVGSVRRLYRTGDICRLLTDGAIDFIGRRDNQVKIRGFRVEPAEIEANLQSIDGVENAAVVVVGDSADRRLAAFCITSDDTLIDAQIKEQLKRMLPRHLVPALIRLLKQMPTTPNGKLDRNALVSLAETMPPEASEAQPATPIETRLAVIWSDVLRRPVKSADTSFFDLGGHSLLALKLFDRIVKEFDADLPISTLFSYPTIRELAGLIDERINSGASSTGTTEEEPWDTSTVIHRGPETPQSPFFIVGGAGGNVNNLIDLGKAIGASRPVIGFQTRGILGHKPRETMEEIAAEHIFYMRRHQPAGPYILAGYSAGAQTAYEMARQLDSAGQEVSTLFLIDTFAPGFAVSLGTDDPFAMPIKLGFFEKVRDEISFLKKRRADYLLMRLRSKLISRIFRGPMVDLAEKVSPTFARSRRTSQALFRAARDYQAEKYDGAADLIFSQPFGLREERLVKLHPHLGWEGLIDLEKLRVTRLDTTHLEMVRGEYAQMIARLVEERLRCGRS